MLADSNVHTLARPTLVHQLKERKGKVYTTKCGLTTEDGQTVSGWYTKITCDECSP